MKYIKFCDEVISVPESVTFWIYIRGKEYVAPFCVNMSSLEKQDFMGEPTLDSIIRSEGYTTIAEARARLLDEILSLFNG